MLKWLTKKTSRPATALFELLDEDGGVLASGTALFENFIEGKELVTRACCVIEPQRAMTVHAVRCSAARHEVTKNFDPIKLRSIDSFKTSAELVTTSWRLDVD
jgi:hypothetical protein